jgi:ADP-ribose pyrophosphatase YjhB (NUDIX family)
MDLGEHTQTAVAARIARLHDEYDPGPVQEVTYKYGPDDFAKTREMVQQGEIGYAGAWVTDDRNRALLIRQDTASGWVIPGGGTQADELLEATARREVREETGIECSITGVDSVRRQVHVHESNPEERVFMVSVTFEARYEGGEISETDEDVDSVRWFVEAPAHLDDFIQAKVREWNGAD